MSHKTLIGGTAYKIKGGKALIGATAYKINGGKTLIGGTNYKIVFDPDWNNPTIITPKNGSTEICLKETPIFYNGYYYCLSTTSATTSYYSNAYLQVGSNLSTYTQRGGLGQSNGLHIVNGKLMTRTSIRPTSSTNPGNTMYIYYGTPNGTSTSMSSKSFQVVSATYHDMGFEAYPDNFVYYNGNYYCLFKQVTDSYRTYLTPGMIDSNFTTWQDDEPVGQGLTSGECSDDDLRGLYLGSDRIFFLHYDDSANSEKRGFVKYKLLSNVGNWLSTSNWSSYRFTTMDCPLCFWKTGSTYYIAGTRYHNASGNRITLATSTDGATWTEKYLSNTLDTYSSTYGTTTNYSTANYINNKLVIAVGTYGQASDTTGLDLYVSDNLSTINYYHVDTPAGYTIPGTAQFDGYNIYLNVSFQGRNSRIIKF